MAATDPDRFLGQREQDLADVDAMVDRVTVAYRHLSGAESLAWLQRARSGFLDAVTGLDPGVRVPWYGPDMTLASSVTARIMETWAHGQDIADTARNHPPRHQPAAPRGLPRRSGRAQQLPGPGSARPRHRYPHRGDRPRRRPMGIRAGGGGRRGPGPALDFCLVVTQRRHPDDTACRRGTGRHPVAVHRPGLRRPARPGPPARGVRRGRSMSDPGPKRAVRIANCSGFYGDRLAAPAEMLAGPDPIDVLTGDYLAELTMLILWKARQKDAGAGYATTFLRQMEDVLGTCLERGIKVVDQRRRAEPDRPGRPAAARSPTASACPRRSRWSQATTSSTFSTTCRPLAHSSPTPTPASRSPPPGSNR